MVRNDLRIVLTLGEPDEPNLRCITSINLYNFMHYLLKRPYVDNWEREMQEDYLFADTTQLRQIVTGSGKYDIKHKRLCRSKVFEQRTIKDLGFLPPVTTHIELVLVRN